MSSHIGVFLKNFGRLIILHPQRRGDNFDHLRIMELWFPVPRGPIVQAKTAFASSSMPGSGFEAASVASRNPSPKSHEMWSFAAKSLVTAHTART